MEERAEGYNRKGAALLDLERQGRALVLAPADIGGISTLRRNAKAMERLYGYGYQDGARLEAFLGAN